MRLENILCPKCLFDCFIHNLIKYFVEETKLSSYYMNNVLFRYFDACLILCHNILILNFCQGSCVVFLSFIHCFLVLISTTCICYETIKPELFVMYNVLV